MIHKTYKTYKAKYPYELVSTATYWEEKDQHWKQEQKDGIFFTTDGIDELIQDVSTKIFFARLAIPIKCYNERKLFTRFSQIVERRVCLGWFFATKGEKERAVNVLDRTMLDCDIIRRKVSTNHDELDRRISNICWSLKRIQNTLRQRYSSK